MSNFFSLFSAKIVEKVINESFLNENRMYYKIQLSSYSFEGVYDLILKHSNNSDSNNYIEVILLESKKDYFLSAPIIQSIINVSTLKSKKMNKNKVVLSFFDFNHSISFYSEEEFPNAMIDDMLILTIFNRLLEKELSKFMYKDELDEIYLNNKDTIQKIGSLKRFINRLMEFSEMNNHPEVYRNSHLIKNSESVNEEMIEFFYVDNSEFIISEDSKAKHKNVYINFEQIDIDKYEYDAVNQVGFQRSNFTSILEIADMLDVESLKNELLYFVSFYNE